MNLKKADEEVTRDTQVHEIIATHRAVRKSLEVLWLASLILILTSVAAEWPPGSIGGVVGVVSCAVAIGVYDRRKIK